MCTHEGQFSFDANSTVYFALAVLSIWSFHCNIYYDLGLNQLALRVLYYGSQ